MATLVLSSGTSAVTRKVSDLQRCYKEVLEDVMAGHDVLLTRTGEEIAAVVDIERYLSVQAKAATAEDLQRKVELLETRLELALAGGPSLAEARERARREPGKTATDVKEAVRRRRAAL